MLYLSIFEAKESTTQSQIARERGKWLAQGKDKLLLQRCKAVNRYEILGISPLKIYFIIDTEDPTAMNLLTRHFGDEWDSVTFPVIQREIAEALAEDHTIIGG